MLALSSPAASKDIRPNGHSRENFTQEQLGTSNSLSSTETKFEGSHPKQTLKNSTFRNALRDESYESTSASTFKNDTDSRGNDKAQQLSSSFYLSPGYGNSKLDTNYNSYYLGKSIPKKSPQNAFDRPHWRKKQANNALNRNQAYGHVNANTRKYENPTPNKTSYDLVNTNNGPNFSKFRQRQDTPDDGIFQLERLDDSDHFNPDTSLKNDLDFASAINDKHLKLETTTSQAESYHIPGYVNQENLPFAVGSIIHDTKNLIDYKLLNVLGEGSYAVVYLGRNLADNSLRALKCLSSHQLTCSQKELQQSEIDLQKYVSDNPHIVKLHYNFMYEDWSFLVLELVTGSDLYDYIMQNPTFGISDRKPHHISEAVRLFEQMLDAVSHLHSLRVYHRDLKPENFIIDANGNLKLTDFGLATRESISTKYECGSKPYMSYENRNGGINYNDNTIFGYNDGYSPRLSDIWALGVLLLNLLFAESPWQDPSVESCFRFTNFLRDGSRYLQSNFPKLPKEIADFLVTNVFCPEHKRCSVLDLKLWVAELRVVLCTSGPCKTRYPSAVGAIAIPQPANNNSKTKRLPVNYKSQAQAQYQAHKKDIQKPRDVLPGNVYKGNVTVTAESPIESSDAAFLLSSSVPANIFTNYISKAKAAAANQAMPREKCIVAAKNIAANLRAQQKNDLEHVYSPNAYTPKSKYFRQPGNHQSSYLPSKKQTEGQLSSSCLPNMRILPFDETKYFTDIKKGKDVYGSNLSNQLNIRSNKPINFEPQTKFGTPTPSLYFGYNRSVNEPSSIKHSKSNSFGKSGNDISSLKTGLNSSSGENKYFSKNTPGSNISPPLQNSVSKSPLNKPTLNTGLNSAAAPSNDLSSSFTMRRKSWKPSEPPLTEDLHLSSDLLWSENTNVSIVQDGIPSNYGLDSIGSNNIATLKISDNNITAQPYASFDGYLSDIFEIE